MWHSTFNRLAKAKYERGRREHHDYDPTKLQPDLFEELRSECLDVSNYAKMLWKHINYLEQRYKLIPKEVTVMAKSNLFMITNENIKSILRGLAINVGGALLITLGDWLIRAEFDFFVLKVTLSTAVGAAMVNTVRKYFSEE